MSALALFFIKQGKNVFGYDKTESKITANLTELGAQISYQDTPSDFVKSLLTNDTLIIYTPAIPKNAILFNYFKDAGFQLIKRAAVLAEIVNNHKVIAVAGTHGKTSTSALIAHILKFANYKVTAFLGGILKNYNSNFLFTEQAEFAVVEADEFDKSFHFLKPTYSIVTAVDADHLDIYKTKENLQQAYQDFVASVPESGLLVAHASAKGILNTKAKTYWYALNDANATYSATEIKALPTGFVSFRLNHRGTEQDDFVIPATGLFNIENTLASIIMAKHLGIDTELIQAALLKYQGVERRFNSYQLEHGITLIDDYAHHPTELKALIESVRFLYPNKKITLVFQPHLYSRTNDFLEDFALELSKVDELWLMDIYAARELPVLGVSSAVLLDRTSCKNKNLVTGTQIKAGIASGNLEVLVLAGAGDIGVLAHEIKEQYSKVENT